MLQRFECNNTVEICNEMINPGLPHIYIGLVAQEMDRWSLFTFHSELCSIYGLWQCHRHLLIKFCVNLLTRNGIQFESATLAS